MDVKRKAGREEINDTRKEIRWEKEREINRETERRRVKNGRNEREKVNVEKTIERERIEA